MKRVLACVLSVVLVVGLAPVPASAASEGLHASSLLAASGSDDAAVGAVDVTFDAATQQGLYDAIVEELGNRGISCEKDDASLHVKLSAVSNAAFTTLDASHRKITSIKGLEQFTGLTELDLSHNLVQTSGQFSELKRLERLNLYDNKVVDLSGLKNLAKLKYLNLGDNNEREDQRVKMTGLDALDTLTSLKEFDFSCNATPEVTSHIKELTSLTSLNLMENDIKDVYDLENLTNMKTLILNHNQISGVKALKKMKNLEELRLAHCRLYGHPTDESLYGEDKTGIDELFDADHNLILKNLKKLDVLCNWWIGFSVKDSDAQANIWKLREDFMSGKSQLEEFGYFYHWFPDLNTPNLQKDDGDVKYVCYDDFSPYCDGKHDDYYAIFNAHMYAYQYGCEVRATEGGSDAAASHKPFHIFKYYDKRDLTAYSSIDWQDATFVIHDEKVDDIPAHYKEIMFLNPSPIKQESGAYAYKSSTAERVVSIPASKLTLNEGWSLNTQTTSINGLSPQVDEALANLNLKNGYHRFFVEVYNADFKQYRRKETGRSLAGNDQWDGFIVNENGVIERPNSAKMTATGTLASQAQGSEHVPKDPMPVQWDFKNVTKVTITPIPDKPSYVKNGHFITMPMDSKVETPRLGKTADYRRNFSIRSCANVEFSNVTQTVGTAPDYDGDNLSGNYLGFFDFQGVADIDMHDCSAWDRCCITSSYGIGLSRIVDAKFTNVNSSNPDTERYLAGAGASRWGNTGGNYGKHLLFDHCMLGRIDAHCGYYDLTVRDCRLGTGGLCLTGQGPLNVERTETHSASFINLRADYGSTWDGDATIIDCTHHLRKGKLSQPYNLASAEARYDDAARTNAHDFGYDKRFPNLYVKNFTVDASELNPDEAHYYAILPNHLNGIESLEGYWPDVVQINSIDFVGYEGTIGRELYLRMPYNAYGLAMDKISDYRIESVKYNGKALSANLSDGSDVELNEFISGRAVPYENAVSLPYDLKQGIPAWSALTLDDVGDKDVVIRYTGDEPYISFKDSNGWTTPNERWIDVYAYFVEHLSDGSHIAYFSNSDIRQREAKRQQTWQEKVKAGSITGELLPIGYLYVRTKALEKPMYPSSEKQKVTDGVTRLSNVQLVDTHEAHVHKWGSWFKIDDSLHQRLCSNGPSHVETAAHTWGSPKVTAATTSKSGKRVYTCSVCKGTKTEVIPKLIDLSSSKNKVKVTLSSSRYTYDGKAKKPAVKSVAVNGKTLAKSAYQVSYAKNCISVGSHAVAVAGKGIYGGVAKATYTVIPKGTSLLKVTSVKNGFTASWKKQSTQTSGYQLQYGLNASFAGAKVVTVSGAKKTSAKVSKGLKAGKKYYVRIRTFKTVGGVKYCSDWSKRALSVKVK